MKFESKTLTTTNLSAFLCRPFYPHICSKNRNTWLSLTAGLLKNVRPCDTFSCNLNCFAPLKNTKSRTNHNKFMSIMTCGNLLYIDYTWEIKWTKIALARACMNIKSYPISVPILQKGQKDLLKLIMKFIADNKSFWNPVKPYVTGNSRTTNIIYSLKMMRPLNILRNCIYLQ